MKDHQEIFLAILKAWNRVVGLFLEKEKIREKWS